MEQGQKERVLTPEELRALQGVLLEMLLELDRICNKHGIPYALIGGTLLGAVRHGGFIPWDDDLDTQMTRANYERFRAACENDLDESKYFFQDHTTDPEYRWGYGRLRRKNSEFVRVGQEHLKMKTGIFLDIFITDNVPNFYPARVLHAFYCFALRKVLYSETGAVFDKSRLKRGIYRLLRHIPIDFVFRRLDALAAFWNKRPATYVRVLTFPTPKGRANMGYLARWYTDLAPIEFEGHFFPSIRDREGYLAFKYGFDYMTPPPPDKRHWHPAAAFRLPPGEE